MQHNEKPATYRLSRRDVDRIISMIDSLGSLVSELCDARLHDGELYIDQSERYENNFYRLFSQTLLDLDNDSDGQLSRR